MIDNTTILYGGIAVLGGALIAWLLESKKAWWIVQEKLGKKYEVKKETGTFEKNKEFPVQYFDHKGNEVVYSAHVEKHDGNFGLLDTKGVPIMEVNPDKLVVKNLKSVVAGNSKSLVFQIADERYVADLKDRVDALRLANVQKDEEIKERAVSTRHIMIHDAETENKVFQNRYRGRRFSRFYDKSKGKQQQEEMSMGEPEGEGGGEQ